MDLHGTSYLIGVMRTQDEKLFRAKISDFGLSAHMTAGQTSVSISQGTEAYLPKEVFQNLAITEASDIYALGLLMWEIFYGIFWFIVWDTEKRRKKCAPHAYLWRCSLQHTCSSLECQPCFAHLVYASCTRFYAHVLSTVKLQRFRGARHIAVWLGLQCRVVIECGV